MFSSNDGLRIVWLAFQTFIFLANYFSAFTDAVKFAGRTEEALARGLCRRDGDGAEGRVRFGPDRDGVGGVIAEVKVRRAVGRVAQGEKVVEEILKEFQAVNWRVE